MCIRDRWRARPARQRARHRGGGGGGASGGDWRAGGSAREDGGRIEGFGDGAVQSDSRAGGSAREDGGRIEGCGDGAGQSERADRAIRRRGQAVERGKGGCGCEGDEGGVRVGGSALEDRGGRRARVGRDRSRLFVVVVVPRARPASRRGHRRTGRAAIQARVASGGERRGGGFASRTARRRGTFVGADDGQGGGTRGGES